MRTRGATGKRVERKRSTPPAVEATRVSVRNAARKASKSIHQDSPAGRAKNRERKKSSEKTVSVTTKTKRGKQVTTIATNTAPTPQPPVPAVAAAAQKPAQAPVFSTPPPVAISTNTSVAEKKKENNRNKNYSPVVTNLFHDGNFCSSGTKKFVPNPTIKLRFSQILEQILPTTLWILYLFQR